MQNTILARAQGAKSARAQGANFAWHLQSGLCFSCDIFHILSACACGLCADVTVRPFAWQSVSGNVFVECARCLYAAEFIWLRTGVAYCVSCLLT